MSPCLFMENKMKDHPQTMAMQQLQGSGAGQMSEEQEAELRYEAGMYQSLYEKAKDRIAALEADHVNKEICDSYALENQRFYDRIEALEAALDETEADLRKIVDLRDPLPRAAVREAVAEQLVRIKARRVASRTGVNK
jgi:site-specific recombinase